MEQGIQQILQDIQHQLAELATRKKEFEEQMKQQKEEFEKWKQKEAEKMKQELEEAAIRKDLELIEREKKISAQEEFIRDQQVKNSKIIKLNVGGKQFTTTLTTLTSDKSSMLAAMFSGRHVLEKDEKGAYFIDRDGELFSLILDYLRTGRLPTKLDEDRFIILKDEAHYYQLSSLITALDESPLAKPTSLLNYGLYSASNSDASQEKLLLWLIDNKRLVTNDFTEEIEYTISALQYIRFKNSVLGLIVDSNHIQIKNTLLECCAPALPEYGTTFFGSYFDMRIGSLDPQFIFKQSSVVFQERKIKIEVPTSTRVTSDGVPMIILQNDSLRGYRTIYCFGTACVASYSSDRNQFIGVLLKKKNNQ